MAQIPQFLFACQEEVNSDVTFFSLPPQPQNVAENAPPAATNQVMHLPLNAVDDSNVKFNSIRGFVCFIYQRRLVDGNIEHVQMICKPSTQESSILPTMNTTRVRMMSYYGYDEVNNQLKVLSMTWQNGMNFDDHQVLTYGPGNAWRTIGCDVPHHSSKKGICFNGVLYYPAIDMSTGHNMIVCFDVKAEEFRILPAVIMEGMIEAVKHGSFINYNGRLGILESENMLGVDNTSTHFTMWLLNHATQVWTDHIHEFPASFEDTVGEALLRFDGMISLTNEVVFSSYYPSNPFYLFYYNIVTNTFRKVKIEGMEAYNYRYTCLN
ncbi:PREDICTED: F-box protein DOR-like [Camelina sativa]|uniref:F-box protein DOR-like n=1 Tax=Camelina sativa TaxID=90675 RepID=A0ABM0TPW0_CAMSA|nr:PREDICTED: F-box protein DOR-like [Camelina sativa]